jgi:Protein of unknown function
MVDGRLVASARMVEQAEVDAHAAAWESLAGEPEPLRMLTAAGLLAVPLSYFDEAILARTPMTTFTRAVRVIGALIGESRDLICLLQFDVELLARRIDSLLDAGLLESDNIDADELRVLRIRRPSS